MPLILDEPIRHVKKRSSPLWQGPESDDPQGGVTFSLLSRFISCRDRFRVMFMDGLRANDDFNHKIEYGNMWHACEEGLAKAPDDWTIWQWELLECVKKLSKRYPLRREEVDKWYQVCLKQFPIYCSFWENHPDVTSRTPLVQEKVFSIPYKLPSGRMVRLKGKWDSVDLIEDAGSPAIFLQENKSKGDIKPLQLQRQLSFDLQTMIYLIALIEYRRDDSNEEFYGILEEAGAIGVPTAGVRYNVIRRPLSGGKGNIVQHKPTAKNPAGESKEAYYARLQEYIIAEPETYFMRWKVSILPSEIKEFKEKCLDPILEQLCIWYDLQCGKAVAIGPWQAMAMMHWRHPFGIYNPIDEGGSTDVDEYLRTGSTVGLTQIDNIFPELVAA